MDDAAPHDAPAHAEYAMTVLADRPRAYWRLGEPIGNVAMDSSGNGLHGVYLGSPTFAAPGALADDADTSVAFDGIDDFARITVPPFADNQSVECWTRYSTGSQAPATLIGRGKLGTTTNAGVWLRIGYNAEVQFNAADGTGTRVTAIGPVQNDGLWHHVVGVKDTGEVRLYVDGRLVGLKSPLVGFTQASTPNVLLGGDGISQFLQGGLDEAAVYDLALSEDRIRAHYLAGIAGSAEL